MMNPFILGFAVSPVGDSTVIVAYADTTLAFPDTHSLMQWLEDAYMETLATVLAHRLKRLTDQAH